MQILKQKLEQIEGKGYKAYKQLKGAYSFPRFELLIDHVQGDSYAEPSRCRVILSADDFPLPSDLFDNPIRCMALEDYLGRRFAAAAKLRVQNQRGSGESGSGQLGSGNSGEISIATYGQQVLQRSAVVVEPSHLEIRFRMGLPAHGRAVDAAAAIAMFFTDLPALLETAYYSWLGDFNAAKAFVDCIEDQDYLRQQLAENNLVAFLADGSSLPRMSGIDDRPLTGAVALMAPDSLAVELKQHYGPAVRGLAIKKGVSMIVGGGFHGKSTLLHAVERGVYNHIPGDGRERVVAESSAFKIRAEDGRAITSVDISPFINNLPQGKNTQQFFTENASGSTSQAANIIEAMATGAKALLIDEDTAATNFMIRDERMQQLIAQDKEPITPLVQRIRDLYEQEQVSVLLVMGGSSAFFEAADQVIMLDNYQVKDVTADVRDLVAADHRAVKDGAVKEKKSAMEERIDVSFSSFAMRQLLPGSLNPQAATGKVKIQAIESRLLRYGRHEIELSRVEQLVDRGQLLAIAYLLNYVDAQKKYAADDLVTVLKSALLLVEQKGLQQVMPFIMGELAIPRLQELVATVNRIRGLKLEVSMSKKPLTQ